MDLKGHYAEFIYPNLVALTFPTQLWLVRCDPLGPARMRLFSRIYGLDTSAEVQDAAFEHLEQDEPRRHRDAPDTDGTTCGRPSAGSGRRRPGRCAPPTCGRPSATSSTPPLAPDEFA